MMLLADFELHRHNNVIIGILDVLLLCWLCNVLWVGGGGQYGRFVNWKGPRTFDVCLCDVAGWW